MKGKAKRGQVNCTESTGRQGLQLGVSLNNFKVDKSKNSNMSFVVGGANYAAGAHQFGAFTATSTGVQVTFAYDTGQQWRSG